MFKGLILATQAVVFLNASAAYAALTHAKVVELAAHRIGRMVDTLAIEENYVSRIHKFQLTTLTKVAPTDPAFRVVTSQVPPATGIAHSVELLMSDTGKTLSDKETRGQDSANAPIWQPTDPLTLTEIVLHFVTDSKEVSIQPFKTGAETVTIEQVELGGNKIGRVTISAINSTTLLEVDIDLTNAVLGFRLVNP